MKYYIHLFAVFSATAISYSQEVQAVVHWQQDHSTAFPFRSSSSASLSDAERKLPGSAYIQLSGAAIMKQLQLPDSAPESYVNENAVSTCPAESTNLHILRQSVYTKPAPGKQSTRQQKSPDFEDGHIAPEH